MLSHEEYKRIAHVFPLLQRADSQLVRTFQRAAFFAHIPTGRDVFVAGDQVDAIALLISGVVRVYQIGDTGREIILYRFGGGESCILTANAILSQQTFPGVATVEEDTGAVMIPADALRKWVHSYDLWREFVFDLLSQRLATVMAIVDEVLFHRLDERLARFLLDQGQSQSPIHITHQEIAAEMGSSREAISRILGEFAGQGLIRQGRGVIEILDFASLRSSTVV